MTALQEIDKTWTLFLDRDGVINLERKGRYVNTWNEFEFNHSALQAIKYFSKLFNCVIVVTNQRGVTRGFTTAADLQQIHENMKAAIAEAGGNIDAIYVCIDEEETSPNRKPNTGMALQALEQFPDIDFSKSVMIGDKMSDMQFGRTLGMLTIFLPTTIADGAVQESFIDYSFPSLWACAEALGAGKF